MNNPSKTEIIAQIAQIQFMERGKLSSYTFKERAQPSQPYYKLQRWEEGKNLTRYVRAEQVPLLEQALAGHAQFRELVEQYARLVIQDTREQLSTVGKKKRPGPRPNSSSRRRRKSRS